MRFILALLFCFAIGIASSTAGDSPGVIEKTSIEKVFAAHFDLNSISVSAELTAADPNPYADIEAACPIIVKKWKPVNMNRYLPLLAINDQEFYKSDFKPPFLAIASKGTSGKSTHYLLRRPGWRDAIVKG